MSVYNEKAGIDFTKQYMFFGDEELNVQSYLKFRFDDLHKINRRMRGYFWQPEEFSVQKDRADFEMFRPEQKHIFTSNLRYQTLLDSVQGRGPSIAFLPHATLPEIEECINTWTFFENIHSESYTYIVKNVYSDPSIVFDQILSDPHITARAHAVAYWYNKFIDYAMKYKYAREGDLREVKRLLYMAMMTVNILEGLRFYVSFACTFAFGELKLMEGSAKILASIARDENQHLALSSTIIKNWHKGRDDPEMVQIAEECQDDVYKLWDEAVLGEKEWAEYLFKDGSIIGLNATLLSQYVEHIANRRMKALGFEAKYEQSAVQNPLPWMSNWLDSGKVQHAPQEVELNRYIISGFNSDFDPTKMEGFKL